MSLIVCPFDRDALLDHLAHGACTSADVRLDSRATYLGKYLANIGALTIVVEIDYVDADYLDDYASFYAKSFERIPNRCRRIHLFSLAFDEPQLLSVIAGDSSADGLTDAYLGFIVARPLPTAVIGRTALRTYPPDGGRRHYPTVRDYPVNLFGLNLNVKSLAFQEQDTSLAACATVALWSCFQKTQELFHSSAPTPVAITRAANRLLLAARPFPSRGLQIQQVCNAVAVAGLDPEVYEVTPDLPLATLIYSYLRLGLPVLAVVEVPDVGLHAITLNGYSLRATTQLSTEGANVSNLLPRMIGSRIDEFYGHDDQNGPFCRLKLLEPAAKKPLITIQATGPWSSDLEFKAIVVPVYQKIRTGFREVMKWLPGLSMTASWVAPATACEWDVRLISSNELKTRVRLREIVVPDPIRNSLLTETMPKYLWYCTLLEGSATLLSVLLDTTAMVNGYPIERLWWQDSQYSATVKGILNKQAFTPMLRTGLGERLFETLNKS